LVRFYTGRFYKSPFIVYSDDTILLSALERSLCITEHVLACGILLVAGYSSFREHRRCSLVIAWPRGSDAAFLSLSTLLRADIESHSNHINHSCCFACCVLRLLV
jgi:hypothetical protein